MGFPLVLNKALAGVKKHGLGVCTRKTSFGHVQSGQVGFPLQLNIGCNFANSQVGTRSLEVLLSMLYVVWRSHHTSWGTFWKDLMNMRMSQHIWVHQVLWFCANGMEAGGQRVPCSWTMGSASSGIQTTYQSSIAPKTGGFTLVGGVELGHYDLMGCIPTLQSFCNFPGHLVRY